MRDVAFSNDKIVKSTVVKTRLLIYCGFYRVGLIFFFLKEPSRIDMIKIRKSFSGWDI